MQWETKFSPKILPVNSTYLNSSRYQEVISRLDCAVDWSNRDIEMVNTPVPSFTFAWNWKSNSSPILGALHLKWFSVEIRLCGRFPLRCQFLRKSIHFSNSVCKLITFYKNEYEKEIVVNLRNKYAKIISFLLYLNSEAKLLKKSKRSSFLLLSVRGSPVEKIFVDPHIFNWKNRKKINAWKILKYTKIRSFFLFFHKIFYSKFSKENSK